MNLGRSMSLLALVVASALCAAPASAQSADAGVVTPPAAPSLKTAYVVGEVAHVRASASEAAAVVATLRINSGVKVVQSAEGWSEVKLSTPPVRGFLPAAALSPSRTTAATLRDKLAKAKGPERITLLERLVALEPDRKEHRVTLAAAYREAGQPERAAALEKEPALELAACVPLPGDRPRLAAVLLGRTVPEKHANEIAAQGSAAPELQVARELAAAAWVKLTASGPKAVSGSPFAAPPGYHMLPQLSDPPFGLVLGPCDKEGDLFATVPVRAVTPTESERARLEAKKRWPAPKTAAFWFRSGFGDGPLKGVVPYTSDVDPGTGVSFSGYRLLTVPQTGEVEETDYEIYGHGG